MFTNDTNLPLNLAVMLAHDEYPEPREGVISVTSLLKPIKPLVLGMRLQKDDSGSSKDISTRMASSYGTAIHNAMENAWLSDKLPETLELLGYPPGMIKNIKVNPTPEEAEDCIPIYTEYRIEKEFMGWIISGEFDFVAEGRVRDLKTTGTYTYTHGTNNDKFILQGSMYRWLNPEKITDDVMAIDYVFTDWSALAAKTQKDYPQSRMMEQLFQLKSVEDTENFIKDKLAQVDKYRYAEQDEIPMCTNEDLWVAPSKWKYYKNPNNIKRATRVYDSQVDAMQHFTKDGAIGIVIEHKGEIKACRYCEALSICEQAQRYLNSGELTL